MHTRNDVIKIRNAFKRDLECLGRPRPGALWQYSPWVVTMQTIIELERILEEWRLEEEAFAMKIPEPASSQETLVLKAF